MDYQPSQPSKSDQSDRIPPTRPVQPSYGSDDSLSSGLPLPPPVPLPDRRHLEALAAQRAGGKRDSPVLLPRAQTTSLATRSTALALTHKRSTTTQQCPSCGAMQSTSTSICLSCGTFLRAKSQTIHCRRCGTQASANLFLCPGCGRELHAAAPRPLRWVVPVILVVLILLFVQQAGGLRALDWTRVQLASGWDWVTEVGGRLDPQISIETIPAELSAADADPAATNLIDINALARLVEQPLSAVDNASVADSSNDTNNGGNNVNSNRVDETVLNNLAGIISTTVNSANLGGEGATTTVLQNAPRQLEIEPSPTIVATATSEPTATASATPTPTVAPLPTEPSSPTIASALIATTPATVTGRSGSLSGEPLVRVISTSTPAAQTVAGVTPLPTPTISKVTTAEAVAVPEKENQQPDSPQIEVSILQPTPTPVPSATSEPSPTPAPPTATPIPAITTYKVQAGDTPLAIAGRYDIGVNELLAANGMTIADARLLRVGQELIIPVLGQSTPSVATPAATVQPSATTIGANAPTAPAPASASAIRLDVPQQRSPENGSFLSCGAENSLIWLSVNFMRENDRYRLHLGFLNGYNTDGSENVVWVLEQLQPANATIWRMDEGLCGLAPQDFGRQWRWYIDVVEPTGTAWQSVSLPSTIWAFSWN